MEYATSLIIVLFSWASQWLELVDCVCVHACMCIYISPVITPKSLFGK